MKVQHLQKIKKFYKYVNVVEHPLSFAYAQKLKDDKPFELYTDIRKSSKYYGITIDHKILKSLNRYDLIIPNKTLAHAIAEEWIGQTDEMRTWAMPLNILHSQAIQLELDEMYRKHATNDIMGLLSDDQLCYDLDVESSINMYKNELIQSQRTLSKPIRDYMQERFKISLPSYKMIEERKIENSEIITELINKMDPWVLCVLWKWSKEFKSTSTALCLLFNKISKDHALNVALLEENHQMKYYGLVEGTHDLQILEVKEKVQAGIVYLSLLGTTKH